MLPPHQSPVVSPAGHPRAAMTGVSSFSVLVRAMQVMGLYPYAWPSAPPAGQPRFSLPLLLWAVFLQLVSLQDFVCVGHAYIVNSEASDFGEFSRLCTLIFGLSLTYILKLLMTVQSHLMTDLLQLLDQVIEEVPALGMSPRLRLHSNLFSGLAVAFSLLLGVGLAVSPTPKMATPLTAVVVLLHLLTLVHTLFTLVIVYVFFLWALHYLGKHVNLVVRAIVPPPPTDLPPWPTLAKAGEKDPWAPQLNQLFRLWQRLRKVGVVEDISRCW